MADDILHYRLAVLQDFPNQGIADALRFLAVQFRTTFAPRFCRRFPMFCIWVSTETIDSGLQEVVLPVAVHKVLSSICLVDQMDIFWSIVAKISWEKHIESHQKVLSFLGHRIMSLSNQSRCGSQTSRRLQYFLVLNSDIIKDDLTAEQRTRRQYQKPHRVQKYIELVDTLSTVDLSMSFETDNLCRLPPFRDPVGNPISFDYQCKDLLFRRDYPCRVEQCAATGSHIVAANGVHTCAQCLNLPSSRFDGESILANIQHPDVPSIEEMETSFWKSFPTDCNLKELNITIHRTSGAAESSAYLRSAYATVSDSLCCLPWVSREVTNLIVAQTDCRFATLTENVSAKQSLYQLSSTQWTLPGIQKIAVRYGDPTYASSGCFSFDLSTLRNVSFQTCNPAADWSSEKIMARSVIINSRSVQCETESKDSEEPIHLVGMHRPRREVADITLFGRAFKTPKRVTRTMRRMDTERATVHGDCDTSCNIHCGDPESYLVWLIQSVMIPLRTLGGVLRVPRAFSEARSNSEQVAHYCWELLSGNRTDTCPSMVLKFASIEREIQRMGGFIESHIVFQRQREMISAPGDYIISYRGQEYLQMNGHAVFSRMTLSSAERKSSVVRSIHFAVTVDVGDPRVVPVFLAWYYDFIQTKGLKWKDVDRLTHSSWQNHLKYSRYPPKTLELLKSANPRRAHHVETFVSIQQWSNPKIRFIFEHLLFVELHCLKSVCPRKRLPQGTAIICSCVCSRLASPPIDLRGTCWLSDVFHNNSWFESFSEDGGREFFCGFCAIHCLWVACVKELNPSKQKELYHRIKPPLRYRTDSNFSSLPPSPKRLRTSGPDERVQSDVDPRQELLSYARYLCAVSNEWFASRSPSVFRDSDSASLTLSRQSNTQLKKRVNPTYNVYTPNASKLPYPHETESTNFVRCLTRRLDPEIGCHWIMPDQHGHRGVQYVIYSQDIDALQQNQSWPPTLTMWKVVHLFASWPAAFKDTVYLVHPHSVAELMSALSASSVKDGSMKQRLKNVNRQITDRHLVHKEFLILPFLPQCGDHIDKPFIVVLKNVGTVITNSGVEGQSCPVMVFLDSANPEHPRCVHQFHRRFLRKWLNDLFIERFHLSRMAFTASSIKCQYPVMPSLSSSVDPSCALLLNLETFGNCGGFSNEELQSKLQLEQWWNPSSAVAVFRKSTLQQLRRLRNEQRNVPIAIEEDCSNLSCNDQSVPFNSLSTEHSVPESSNESIGVERATTDIRSPSACIWKMPPQSNHSPIEIRVEQRDYESLAHRQYLTEGMFNFAAYHMFASWPEDFQKTVAVIPSMMWRDLIKDVRAGSDELNVSLAAVWVNDLVDLWVKQWWIIPIAEQSPVRWRLLILYNIKSVLQNNRKSNARAQALLIDSDSEVSKVWQREATFARAFIWLNSLSPIASPFSPSTVRRALPPCVKHHNLPDAGLIMLKYIDMIYKRIYVKGEQLHEWQTWKWFSTDDIELYRRQMKEIVKKLCKEQEAVIVSH